MDTNNTIQLDSEKSEIEISIFGSCVSREMFNFLQNCKVKSYILQNPIHTMFFEEYDIDESKIKASSNFTRRMLLMDCHKSAVDLLLSEASKNCDYLVIDTADCRNDWWQLKSNSNVRICTSVSSNATIQGDPILCEEFTKGSAFSISDEEWSEYVDRFCNILKANFDERRIILNEFNFSRYYYKDNSLIEFECVSLYERQNQLTNKIASMIKERMPNINIISPYEEPVSMIDHHLGLSPLHYLDVVYLYQVEKLKRIIGI